MTAREVVVKFRHVVDRKPRGQRCEREVVESRVRASRPKGTVGRRPEGLFVVVS